MKVGIVGSGLVGSTSAYAMLMQGIGREIVLVDKDRRRAEAEADDLLHAVPFSKPLTIRAGDYGDLRGSRVVIISAGVAQKPGESRLDLLKRNADVFREVIPNVLDNAPDTLFVVATNPVDIMTYLAAGFAADRGVPRERVIGTGTTLDTARFRALLGAHLGVDSHHVHAYVVGEHGDSEVPAWSAINIGAVGLENFCELRNTCLIDDVRDQIDSKVRNAAYNIIQGKGATYYGIGSATAKIVTVLLHDQRSILTVSTPTDTVAGVDNVSVSLPRLVGGAGIMATFPLKLSDDEQRGLADSAAVIREACDEIEASG